MSKLFDKLKDANRERAATQRDRIEAERSAGQAAQAKLGEEKRGLDMARERQAAEVELRRIANARAETEAKAARVIRPASRGSASGPSTWRILAVARCRWPRAKTSNTRGVPQPTTL